MFLRIRPGIAPLFLLLACGTGNAPGGTSPGGAPSAGDGSLSGSGGVTTAGGGASGGAATGGSAGNTGGTNGAANDCTGPFGSPTPVLEIPGTSLGSLVLGPGELELFYSAGPADAPGPQGFFRSVRADRQSAFLPGESLPELDAGCRDSTLGR